MPNIDGISADRERRLSAEQEQALAESAALLCQGWPLHVGKLDRAALHDDAREQDRETK